MGAYLSEPLTAKESQDDADARLRYGASSMQGWRVMQEDAHNSILNFDSETSFFAVYDGHGGPEVAKYCAQKLPDYIKQTEAYQKKELALALEDAFLDFDATLAEPEVIEVLKTLSSEDPDDVEVPTDDGSEEEDNVHNLCEEARMPLEEVMAKYKNKVNTLVSHLQAEYKSHNPLSPNLRPKKSKINEGACSSSSKNYCEDIEPVSSTSNKMEDTNEPVVSTSNGIHDASDSPSPGISSTNDEGDPSSQADSGKSNEVNSTEENGFKTEVENSEPSKPRDESLGPSPDTIENKNGQEVQDAENEPVSDLSQSSTSAVKKHPPGFYNNFLDEGDDDDDESDSNDETFEGKECASSSDDENPVNGVHGDSSDDDVDEEDSSATEYDEEDEEMENFTLKIKNLQGSNSGCTAVVALLHHDQLYVANAGDSRCVVCRDGKAIDMSIDHKPEDKPELDRITKAGGKVSKDGRVNGGLNLSRAIGDLGYKQNKELGPKEQMITAFPDVKTLTINPETDSFMVLACDGIWNFMSSQNVVDFISERLTEGREKLSQICEEMFDHCLAPNTTGDGTGCDNMTAVIVKFGPPLKNEKNDSVKKRPNSPNECNQDTKRIKTDNETFDMTSGA